MRTWTWAWSREARSGEMSPGHPGAAVWMWNFYLPGTSWLTSHFGSQWTFLGNAGNSFFSSKSITKPTRVLILSENPGSHLQFAQGLEGIFISFPTSLSEPHLKAFLFVYILGKSFPHRINFKTFPIHLSVFFRLVGWDKD